MKRLDKIIDKAIEIFFIKNTTLTIILLLIALGFILHLPMK